jgi:ADP-ribose pyrophosphatase
VESAPHDQARGENNPLYRGKRTTVDDEFVPWKQVWANYKPQTFTAKIVLENSRDLSTGAKWADPPEVDGLRGELEKRLTYEHGGIINFGGEGAPLNPRGRTGLRGRGLLGQWGPNHAADPIVTRREPLTNQLQVLAIKRKDTGEWALPGGMVKAGDSVSATVKKSINEVGNFSDPAKQQEFDAMVKVLFEQGNEVYAGYVDDPRNTDNAWMESKAVHFHCTPELGQMLPLNIKKRGKAKGGQVGWLDANLDLEPRYASMYGSHTDWVEKVKERMAKESGSSDLSTRASGLGGVQMEGMNENKRAFQIYEGKQDVTIALKNGLADRCVKIHKDGKLDAIDSDAKDIKVDTFPVLGSAKKLGEYGCGLAVQIYFNFHVDGMKLFLLLFVISIYTMAENDSRNDLRNTCRKNVSEYLLNFSSLISPGAGYGVPNNFANVTEWMADVDPQDRCGYGALQIRRVNEGADGGMTETRANAGNLPQVPNYLTLAMGTCTEATTRTSKEDLGYSLGLPAQQVTQYGYIRQSSELCDGVWFSGAQIVSYWLEFISVVVLLAFFTREFYKTKSRADEFDHANLTTSDFSVMLEGLDRAVEVDDKTVVENGEVLVEKGLTSKLIDDLEQMGFKLGEEVYSVEVARVCKAAIKNMTKLAKLRTQRQELQAGRIKASNDAGSSSRASQESLPAGVSMKEMSATRAPTAKGAPLKYGSSKAMQEASQKTTTSKRLRKKFKDTAHMPPWMQDRMEQLLQKEIHDTEVKVSELVKAQDLSTGHAFIIFNEEAKRNEFIKRVKKPLFSEQILFSVMKILGGERIVKVQKACRLDKLASRTEKFLSHSGPEMYSQKRLLHFESCTRIKNLKIEIAPEPSDIFWENLEMTKQKRLTWNIINLGVMGTMIVLSFFLLIYVSVFADTLKSNFEDGESADETTSPFKEDNVVIMAQTTALGFAASSVTVVTNALISVVALRLSKKAGPTSQTGFQRSIFTMLATFYLLNTSITPFFAGMFISYRSGHMTFSPKARNFRSSAVSTGQSNVIFQVWFDSGGVVNNMLFTLLSSTFSFAFSQMFPVMAVAKRHVLSLRATSQHKLNDLYRPPVMHVGKNYAKLVKAISLVIIYGPLFPLLYLVAAAYLVVSFYAARVGIAYWFARPSFMTERVMERMRGWLAVSVGISLIFKRFAMANAGADAPLILSVVVWIGYMMVYETVLYNFIAKTIRNDADLDSLDAEGVVFKDVVEENPEKFEMYVCPKLHRGEQAAESARSPRSDSAGATRAADISVVVEKV